MEMTERRNGLEAAHGQKNKAIDLAVQAIEKQFGKGSIMRLGAEENLIAQDVPAVPTGSMSLDIALGIGGYPRGRIVEIYGPESSGKTTLTLHAIAEVQKQGGVAAFVDAEHALDVSYARKLGVRTDDLLISQPDTGEQALEIADMLVRSGGIDLLVVDSVAALVPRAEIEGEMGDSHMGLQARLMSQALRKLTGTINRSKTLVVFINQIRMKIGVMFGNPETTTGGNALKFYSSVRLDIRRISAIKDGENVVGNRTRVKVVKNKMAPPFKEVEFDILYGEGISKEGDLLDLAASLNVIEKSGTWYTYKDERLGQGRENARNYLKERPQYIEKIREEVLKKAGIKTQSVAASQGSAASPENASDTGAKARGSSASSSPSAGAASAKAAASATAATKMKQ
jgi:recombination protein RecA